MVLNRDCDAEEQDRAVPRSLATSTHRCRMPECLRILGEDLKCPEPSLLKHYAFDAVLQFGFRDVDEPPRAMVRLFAVRL